MIKINGLTLIELLISLALLSLLTCMSLAAGGMILHKNQLDVLENDISTAVRYARNRALLFNVPLSLSPLADSDWSEGMVLFADNKQHRYTKKDKIFYQWRWHHPGLRVSWYGFRSNHYLLFSPELKHTALSGHFTISNGQQHRELVLNRYGHITNRDLN